MASRREPRGRRGISVVSWTPGGNGGWWPKPPAEGLREGPEHRGRKFRENVQGDDARGSEFDGGEYREWVQQTAVEVPVSVDAARAGGERDGAGCQQVFGADGRGEGARLQAEHVGQYDRVFEFERAGGDEFARRFGKMVEAGYAGLHATNDTDRQGSSRRRWHNR